MQAVKILIVATSHEKLGDTGRKTGLWLQELAIPYYIFRESGAVITLVSPKGGRVPLEPKSESIIAASSTTKRFLKDPEAISMLKNSIALSTQKAEDFDLVFLPGGHGPMWDFTDNGSLKKLLEDFNRQDKLIGAVCHGVAGLLSPVNSAGEPLVKGRQVTSFSNSEELASGLETVVPFLLESALVGLGASYTRKPDFLSHLVIDGNIITGQNPASSMEVALKLLHCMKKSIKNSAATAR
ncbi:MAG TPA: type 1 glutamine amidotransferase domain-containing protein [Puia sp.]|jgi:putative intracellular protease/amidase|nr:type 1 glutamine amidotransferase domain-containing protein [Puia sp.]